MLAHQYQSIEIFQKATNFASSNFEIVTIGEEFLKLEEDQLNAIISNEDLHVTSEEAVFLNLIKWIDHDKPNREKSVINLLPKVRYWLLNPEFIQQHRSRLPDTIECLKIVCTWLEWHSLPIKQRPMKPMKFLKPKYANKILFVGGGAIQTYDPEQNIWSREEFSELPKQFDSIVAFQNKLIISRKNFHLAYFDPQTREITNFTLRTDGPSSYEMAVLNDEVFVIGGNQIYRCRIIMQNYNLIISQIKTITTNQNFCVQKKLAIAGGHLYIATEKGMICLNPLTNKLTPIGFPGRVTADFGFTEFGGNIYKIGGRLKGEKTTKYYWDNDPSPMFPVNNIEDDASTVEIYQPNNNIWVGGPKMKISVFNPHCISWNNRLITCGGFDTYDCKPQKWFQEYNPCTKGWRELAPMIEYKESTNYALVAFK